MSCALNFNVFVVLSSLLYNNVTDLLRLAYTVIFLKVYKL